MRCIFSVALLASCLPALGQSGDPAVDSEIRAAQTAKSPETLEKRADELEGDYRYDVAQRLLEAALHLRGQVSGDQSADYGLCLLKLGALERRSGRTKEAAIHYAQAVRLLPGRPETASVFLYLGISELNLKDTGPATEHFQRARAMDPGLSGPVLMWTAYMQERHMQPEEAEANYKSALGLEKPDSLEALETLTLFSRFLQQHGRESEAQEFLARAAAIRNVHPSRTRPAGAAASASARAAATVVEPAVHRAGGGVTQPVILQKGEPPYSEEARVAKYSATVLVQLVVGADGVPHKIKVIRPAGFGLDDCAIAAISKWRFKPGQKEGNAVPVFATVEVNFRLL